MKPDSTVPSATAPRVSRGTSATACTTCKHAPTHHEPRRVDDATFAAHDAALGAQIDAHRERAETIEALSVSVAYLATLPVPGYTGTHNPRPQESYDDTAYRLAVILARLAKAHRDIAAHVAARDRA